MTEFETSPPLVSIVTPSYNQAQFIEETIQSVARQRYSNVEHIVVDGESDDGTLEILEAYDDEITWISEPDEGQSDAINKGFEMASGDIVGWLNSDDVYFDRGVLGRVVGYFDQFEADVVYGDMALLDADSNVLKLQVVPDFDYDRLLLKCFIEQPSLFFGGHVLEDERLDTDREYVMDYEFWLRLARDYEFRHVDDVLAGDRNHSERKILDQRDAMQAEAEELRAEYGGPTGAELARRRKIDVVRSGVPRAMTAATRTIECYWNTPDLAFDGALKSLPSMLRNISRPNRELL
ncbi:glycosyltransferase family 2 protein [Halorhabdus sp. CUG00001]|uniref:glycosyltransferase family 2 protein n=1 Tax=Halorhabdus sp. CUG00001 TaxID=2600297 RepID=UPI00131E1AE3|nr:glycosyltransferase family 2 protein [Halorhabdus sp. CUG00001]